MKSGQVGVLIVAFVSTAAAGPVAGPVRLDFGPSQWAITLTPDVEGGVHAYSAGSENFDSPPLPAAAHLPPALYQTYVSVARVFKEPFVVVGTRGRGPVVVMKRDLQEGHNVHVVRAREQPSATEPPAIAATRDLALRLQGYSRDDDPLGAYYLLRQSWDDVRKTQYQHTKDFVAAPDFLLGPFYADADWLGWRAEEVSRFPAAARDEEVNLKAALFRAVAGNRLPEPLFASDSQANGPLNMKLQSDRDWPAGFLLALAYEQLAALNEVSKVVAAYVLHRLIRERDSILPATSALLGSLPRAHRELVEAAIGAFRGRRAGP